MIKPFNSNFSTEQKLRFERESRKILDNGQFILGKHNEFLEEALGSMLGGLRVVTMSSGTTALECIFDFFVRFGSQRLVAVQSNTNFATVSSVLRAGGEVVFIDCDKNGQLDYDDLLVKHEMYCFDTVVAVHIGGYMTENLKKIQSFCTQNGLVFIEDCAHAHGSSFEDLIAGTCSDASIFSFFPTKLINGSEGGSVNSSNDDLIEFARKWRNQGKGGVFGNDHSVLGGSYRMPEFNALLASLSLENLEAEISKRKEISEYICSNLVNFECTSPVYMKTFSGYKLILRHTTQAGTEIEEYLKSKDIICGGAVYRNACHVQPVFEHVTAGRENLKNTDYFCLNHFCPPLHSGLSKIEVDRIVDALAEFQVFQK